MAAVCIRSAGKMRLFQGAHLLAVLLILCNLSVLAEGKTIAVFYTAFLL